MYKDIWRNGLFPSSIAVLYFLTVFLISLGLSILAFARIEEAGHPWLGFGAFLVCLVGSSGTVGMSVGRFLTRRARLDEEGVTFTVRFAEYKDENGKRVPYASISRVEKSPAGTIYLWSDEKVAQSFDRYTFWAAEALGREIARRAGKPFEEPERAAHKARAKR